MLWAVAAAGRLEPQGEASPARPQEPERAAAAPVGRA
jgi:hypothetical protein